jgi:thioredoxin reductase (NADPH)
MSLLGSGPAGYTAAICCQNKHVSVLYQGIQPGGQLTTTNEVKTSQVMSMLTGTEMMVQLQTQVKRFGTDQRWLGN